MSEGRELDKTLREGKLVVPWAKPRAEGDLPAFYHDVDMTGMGFIKNPAGSAWAALTSFGGFTGPTTYGRPLASVAKAAHFFLADPLALLDIGVGAARVAVRGRGAVEAAMRMMKGFGVAEFKDAPGMLLHKAVVPPADVLEKVGVKPEVAQEVADVLNQALKEDPALQELAYVKATPDPEAALLGGAKTRAVDLRGAVEARQAAETGNLSPRLQEQQAKLMALFPEPEKQGVAQWLLENHTGVSGEAKPVVPPIPESVPRETAPASDISTPTPAPGEAVTPLPGASPVGGEAGPTGVLPAPETPPAAPPATPKWKPIPEQAPQPIRKADVTHSYFMGRRANAAQASPKGQYVTGKGEPGYGFTLRWEETGKNLPKWQNVVQATTLGNAPEGMVAKGVKQIEVGYTQAKGWHIRKWYAAGESTPRPAASLLEKHGLTIDPASPTLVKLKGRGTAAPRDLVVENAKKVIAKAKAIEPAPTGAAPTPVSPEARAAAAARRQVADRAEAIAAKDAGAEKASWETAQKATEGRFGRLTPEEFDQLDAVGLRPPPPREMIHEGAVRGPAIELTTPGGRKIRAHRELVDMRQIDGSNTRNGLPEERFPSPMQPRTMDIAAVEGAAKQETFSIPSALADDPTGANGPPQVVASVIEGKGRGMIVNGNHRARVQQIAVHENGFADAWMKAVAERAKAWGIPEDEAAKALKKFGPNAGLVTVIDEPHPRWSDLFSTAKDLQQRVDFGFTEANQALMHAHYLEPFYRRAVFPVELSVEEAVNKIPQVRDEFERALGSMPQSMVRDLVNPIVTESGKKSWKFTEAGRRYMEQAALAHVLTDARAMDLAGQYPVISDGITRAFGTLRALGTKVASGELSRAWEFTPRIKAALELQKWADASGQPASRYFVQTGFQGVKENIPTMSPDLVTSQDKLSALFAEAILTLKNKPKQLADLFSFMAKSTENRLTEAAAVDPAEVLIGYMRSNPAFKKRALNLDFDQVMQGYSLDKFTGTETLGELADLSKGPLREVPRTPGEVQASLNEFKAYDAARDPEVAPLAPSSRDDTLLQHLETHPEAGRSIGGQAEHDAAVAAGLPADDGYNEMTTVLDETMRRPGAGGLDRSAREMTDLPKFVDAETLTPEHVDDLVAHTQETLKGDPAKIKTPTAAKARKGAKKPPIDDGFDPKDVVSNGWNPLPMFSRGALGEHTRGPLWFLGVHGSEQGRLAFRMINYAAVKTQDVKAAVYDAFRQAIKGAATSGSDEANYIGRRLNLKDKLFSNHRALIKAATDEVTALRADPNVERDVLAASEERLKGLLDSMTWLEGENRLMSEYEAALSPAQKERLAAASDQIESLVNTLYAMHQKSAGKWKAEAPPDLRAMPLSWKVSRVMGGKGVRRFGQQSVDPRVVELLKLADKDASMNVGMFTEAGVGTYTHDIFEIFRAYGDNAAKKSFLDPVLNFYKTTQAKLDQGASRVARRGLGPTRGAGLLTTESNPALLELPDGERHFINRWVKELSGEKTSVGARMQEQAYLDAADYTARAQQTKNPAMRSWYETKARVARDVAKNGDPLMRSAAAINGMFTRGLLAGSLSFYLKNGFQMASLAEANPLALLAGMRNFTFSAEGRQFARDVGINREVTFMLENDIGFKNRMAEFLGHKGDAVSAVRELGRAVDDFTTKPMTFQEFLNRGLAFHVGLADFMLKRKIGTMQELADSGLLDEAVHAASDFSDRHNGIFGPRGKNPYLQGNWFARTAAIFSHYAGNQAELVAAMGKRAIDDHDIGPILQYVLHTGWAASVANRAGLDVTDWFGIYGARPPFKVDPESPFFLSNAPFNALKAAVGTVAYGNPYADGYDPGKYAQAKAELYRSSASMMNPLVQFALSGLDRREGPDWKGIDFANRYTNAWRAERQKAIQTSRGSTLAPYNADFADRANAWFGVKSLKVDEARKIQRKEYVQKSQRAVALHEARAEMTQAYKDMTDEKNGTKESRAAAKKKLLALSARLEQLGISKESQVRAVDAEIAKSEETVLKFLKEDPILPNGEPDKLWEQEARWYLKNGKRKELYPSIRSELERLQSLRMSPSPR